MSQIGKMPAKFLSIPSSSLVCCHRCYAGLTGTYRSAPKSHFRFECSRMTYITRYGTAAMGITWHTRVTASFTGCMRPAASHVISSTVVDGVEPPQPRRVEHSVRPVVDEVRDEQDFERLEPQRLPRKRAEPVHERRVDRAPLSKEENQK